MPITDKEHVPDCASWQGKPCDCIAGVHDPGFYDKPSDDEGFDSTRLNQMFGNKRT